MERNTKNDFKEDIIKIYTPLSVAKKEIWRRWNDKKLKKKVENFLGGNVPYFFYRHSPVQFVMLSRP